MCRLLTRFVCSEEALFAKLRLRSWLSTWHWLRGEQWNGSVDIQDANERATCVHTVVSQGSKDKAEAAKATEKEGKESDKDATRREIADGKQRHLLDKLVRKLMDPKAADPEHIDTAYAIAGIALSSLADQDCYPEQKTASISVPELLGVGRLAVKALADGLASSSVAINRNCMSVFTCVHHL